MSILPSASQGEQRPNTVSASREFIELATAIDERIPSDRAAEMLAVFHDVVRTAALAEAPSRFSATPAEVDQYLRTILCEDTYLRYQQAIGRAVSAEAAATIRREIETDDEESPANETWLTAADVIDASDMGGPYPSRLLCSKHGGFGPCPGAPWCTPRQHGTEGGAR